MNDYIYEKTGHQFMPTGRNLDELARKLGFPPGSINHKKLRYLVAMDDWETVAKWAMPLLYRAGE